MSMNLNVRPYNNKELLLFPGSVGDYLPPNHLAHVIDEAVDEINLEPYYKKISPVGNSPYHPALMIKIWFYGYATNVKFLKAFKACFLLSAAYISRA